MDDKPKKRKRKKRKLKKRLRGESNKKAYMRKKRRTRKDYLDKNPSKYVSKDPVKRARSLANLQLGRGRRGLPPREANEVLKLMGWEGAILPDQYPDDIIGFAQHHFIMKQTREPIVLLNWQMAVLISIFYSTIRPKLAIAGSVKKSGKSELAAVVALWFMCNVPMSENYILSSDFDAGADVIFQSLRNVVMLNPILAGACKVTKDTITFLINDSFIKVLPCDISIAGLRPNLTLIDEAWSFRTESSIRTLDEMTTNPVGDHLTLVTTTAGYTEDCGENLHLWRWYTRGRAIQEGKEEPDPLFYFLWKESYKGVPWVEGTNYLDHQLKILRLSTYKRFHENKWSSAIDTFLTSDILDRCIDPTLRPGAAPKTRIVCAIDCGPKWDCSALVALAKDDTRERGVRLVDHRIYEPRGKTISFERTIEQTMVNWSEQYTIVDCYFDPYQMLRSAQALKDKRIKMTEFNQSVPNMVSATTSLSELIHSQNIRLYPNTTFRQHLLSASTKEHSQGLRLVKTQRVKKIDAAIALAMAVEAAMKHFLLGSKRKGHVYTPDEDSPGEQLMKAKHDIAMGIAMEDTTKKIPEFITAI